MDAGKKALKQERGPDDKDELKEQLDNYLRRAAAGGYIRAPHMTIALALRSNMGE